MKRHTRLSFEELMIKIYSCQLQFISLLFANAMLVESLSEEKLKNELVGKRFGFEPDDKIEENYFEISGSMIFSTILDLAKSSNISYNQSVELLARENFHFLRTKFLNTPYEAIMNYLDGFEGNRQKLLKRKFFNEPWFQVLHVLRNNASHFDNYGKYIEFDWAFKEEVINWGSLVVKKSDIGHEIVYRDKQILELLRFCIRYLQENRSVLE